MTIRQVEQEWAGALSPNCTGGAQACLFSCSRVQLLLTGAKGCGHWDRGRQKACDCTACMWLQGKGARGVTG